MYKGLKALSIISTIGTIASLILNLVERRNNKIFEQTITRKVNKVFDNRMPKTMDKSQRYKATELGFTSTKVGP